VAKAPREFDIQARNPANTVHIGGDQMVFGGVYGCPFIPRGQTSAATPPWDDFPPAEHAGPDLPRAGQRPAA